jgi:hypothetical protein
MGIQSILVVQDEKLYVLATKINPGGNESHCKQNAKIGGESGRLGTNLQGRCFIVPFCVGV